jgi:cytochrome c biogenesis protein CcdA
VYWRKVSVSALALSAGIIAVFVLAVISLMILGFAGYAHRLYLILLIAWIAVVGLHLAHFPPEESRAGRR